MQLHCNGATPWAVQSQFRKARSLARAETRGRLAHSTPSATSIATQSVGTAVTHTILPAPKDAHFTENRTVFAEEFRIRGNEAGPDQRANIITIANLLQEIGGNHGVAMWGRASSGFAAMPGMDHLIFVATRMQIRMEAYPNWWVPRCCVVFSSRAPSVGMLVVLLRLCRCCSSALSRYTSYSCAYRGISTSQQLLLLAYG
eukprot:GHRR01008396.1.p1 GENE.GHRR01008396.1~~GHRR01008396.1.p1  ORF type:complete len:201 (+),score=25.43 GHRR01008396.1:244-846(+)